MICDGEQLRAVATRGYPKEYEALARQGFSPTSAFRQLLSAEPFVHLPDPATPGMYGANAPAARQEAQARQDGYVALAVATAWGRAASPAATVPDRPHQRSATRALALSNPLLGSIAEEPKVC